MPRFRFAIRWMMVGIVAVAILLAGIFGGGIWGGFLLAFGGNEVLGRPTPLQVARFWVFVVWWFALILVVIGLRTSDRLKAAAHQGRRWPRRIALGMTTTISLVALIGTVVFTGLEAKSRRYERLSSRYYDLCVKDSPKVTPNGDMAKFAYYDKLANKYGIASQAPWLPVAPDPPEPK